MIDYANILIIADMPDQITLIGGILEKEGYRVFAAISGMAAKRFLEMRQPDLILLDMQMGDISGLELCRQFRSDKKTKDIPIVFLTARSDMESISQGFELGASDYIRKPFIKEEFLARIRTQLRLSGQRRELVAVNKELIGFCTAVTHDLKAPFTIIYMLIDMLKKELGEGQPENISQIMEMVSLKTMQAKVMIERLFEYSRMCNVEPRIERTDVEEIVRDIYTDLRSLCPERDITFTCGRLPVVVADRTLIHMAMKNLLQNAIKYTSKKKKAVITVSAEHDSAYYVIKVKDNGAGFDMQYADKIFQVFERLHREEEFQGTGVGLALVNRIMMRHNGRIEAYAKVDEGAEFTLYFPKNIRPKEE